MTNHKNSKVRNRAHRDWNDGSEGRDSQKEACRWGTARHYWCSRCCRDSEVLEEDDSSSVWWHSASTPSPIRRPFSGHRQRRRQNHLPYLETSPELIDGQWRIYGSIDRRRVEISCFVCEFIQKGNESKQTVIFVGPEEKKYKQLVSEGREQG